jgi:hypothetical protein
MVLGLTYLEGSHLSSLFRTNATVGGFYWQDVQALDEDDLWSRRGYSLLFSAATGFEYDTRRLEAETDRRAVVNVIGPHLDWSLYSGRLAFRWELGAYGDFAMVDSYALGPEFQPNPTPPLTTALRAHGYYYATGATAVSRARLDYRRISLTGEARANHFVSIDGLDRERSPLDADYKDFTDDRISTLGTFIVRPWGGALSVVAFGEWIGRRGTIGGGRASRKGFETAAGLQLMWAP